MPRTIHALVVSMLAGQVLVVGQAGDAAKVMADVRVALGGDKVAAVKTVLVSGRSLRTGPDGTSNETEFELWMELPDRFMKRDLVMAMGPTSIYRNTGFNRDGLINLTDTPPALASGNARFDIVGPGSGPPGVTRSPEQIAEARRHTLALYKQDFARLALGMFASSFASYPLTFEHGGTAESPDGSADVILVRGADDFDAKLFVDRLTHMPLMLSWMAKEPLMMQMQTGPGRGALMAGGRGQMGPGPGEGARMTPEQIAQMQKEGAARMAEAEKNRRVVEYRMFYAGYKTYDGVKLPTRIQRTVDGKPAEEIVFDRIKLNTKIDARVFEVTKAE